MSQNARQFECFETLGVDNMLLDFGTEQQQTIERAQYVGRDFVKLLGRPASWDSCSMGIAGASAPRLESAWPELDSNEYTC